MTHDITFDDTTEVVDPTIGRQVVVSAPTSPYVHMSGRIIGWNDHYPIIRLEYPHCGQTMDVNMKIEDLEFV